MYYTDFAQIPRDKYSIVLADPAWTYDDKCNAGKRGAVHKYKLMTPLELRQMPVAEIASPDSICFMWATYPKLPEALHLMRVWGFEYKTVAFTWVKRNKISPSWFWGMGRWTRANAEIVLLGVRGKPTRASAAVHQIIDAPIAGHSRKPSETRDRIVTLMGDIPRIELFARGDVQGWDAWGNTPNYEDSNDSTPVLK